jgi:hypothetical protein
MISRCANPACLAVFHHRKANSFDFPKEYVENQGVALKACLAARTDSSQFFAVA